ncbi:MAG TPA: endonuclease NucS domain-containing protein [Planctomycetaceae bacterium]|nr:endonuclease NucS domain-containing protein [Planctomycetaceae bacterium]
MPRYWVIAPVESKPAELFDKVWQFDLANSLISIGWKQLGDVAKMSREELSGVVASTYPDKPPQTKGLYANMIWAFYHEIGPGDFVIARRGRKTLAAVGKVTEPASYTPGKNPVHGHPSFLKVSWQELPRDKVYSTVVFPMHTLAELTEEQFRNLLDGSGVQPVPSQVPEEVEDPSAFVLEKYLEDFIVSNFHTIFKGQLKIYEDAEGNDGQQYATDIGPIDILAVDSKSGSFVVIELKKGRPSDQVVGQVLRYMGWVKKNLCAENQAVRGLVICRDPDPKLSYALEMTNNIDVRYYSVSFKLSETPQQ